MRFMAILLSVLFAGVAAAEPAGEIFEQFGLFGAWAVKCEEPPSAENPHVLIVRQSSDMVLERHELGPNYAVNHYNILSAKRLDAQRLQVEVIFQPGGDGESRQQLIFLVRGNTRRTIYNKPDDERARVKDGVVLASGIKMPLLRKCN